MALRFLAVKHARLVAMSTLVIAGWVAAARLDLAGSWLSRPAIGNVNAAVVRAGDLPPPLGAHTLLGQEDGFGADPALTTAVNTAASGSSMIAFSAGYASNTNGPTDNKGNIWEALGAPVVYEGYDGAFDVKAYVALDARGGTGHVLSIVKDGRPNGELTLPFIEIEGAGSLQAVATNYPRSVPITSGSVTTTGPATLVALWWGDAPGLHHSAVPNNGFTIIENFVDLPPNSAVQCVVAYKQVSAAGVYDVTWTSSPEEGAPLWLFAFQSTSDRIYANGFD